ncbi:hypothetical protein [Spelaeicoccus albus]|uniref:Uncharacterized protein n=1 Tax=Spelaeicoccus albus TaxID=1280376 RepID=A0A7Z0D309_9MICO|nr:hypothetical protein [Spelaeicoccus albus]NYI67906.1 hypothetical protein [Spelaeicoccus albus]
MPGEQVRQLLLERRRLTNRIIGLSIAQLDAVPAGADESRRGLILRAIGSMADLGARAEGRPVRPVPDAGDRTLADRLAVMIDDVALAGAGPDLDEGIEILVGLRRAL